MGLFKTPNGRCSYNDAIVWQGEKEYDAFTGGVYIDDKNFERIKSIQYVKQFPFKPKTFFVDVKYIPVSKQDAGAQGQFYTEDLDGNCYYTVLKDPKQLDQVFGYYDRVPLTTHTK